MTLEEFAERLRWLAGTGVSLEEFAREIERGEGVDVVMAAYVRHPRARR